MNVSPNVPKARVLVAEDQPHVLEALYLLLKGEGYLTELANSPAAVLEAVRSREFDAVLMDLNYARDTTSGSEGMDLLTHVLGMDSTLPVVVMTAWGSVDLAVEAMHRGARDFVQKPWENARLLRILQTQIEEGRTRRRELRLSQQESEDAVEIQNDLLPREIPRIPGLGIAVAWQPARSVGGDYYDVLNFGNKSLALAIGDVVGKGIPAALLMSNIQAGVRAFASAEASPSHVCGKLNELIGGNLGPGRFITAFYARLEIESKTLVYSRAGHNAPILVRADGSLLRLEEGGSVIGGLQQGRYEEGRVQLGPGDRLLLFTDGIPEARNARGEEFSEAQLGRLARKSLHLGADALRDAVMNGVSEFCENSFHDDATLIVVALAP